VKQDTVMEAIGQVLSSRRGIWIDGVTGHCKLIGSTLQCWPLYTCVYVYIYTHTHIQGRLNQGPMFMGERSS
jgi:hypothetical protein